MKIIFFAAMIALLAGCTGRTSEYYAQKDIDSLQKGVTSERSVMSRFGEPMSQTVDSRGNKEYEWNYAYDSGDGNDQVVTKTIDVTINKKGVVDSYESSIH